MNFTCMTSLYDFLINSNLKRNFECTLEKRTLYHRYVFVFKYINGLIDYNFNKKRNSDVHSYNTKKKDNFRLPVVGRNYGKQRLLYQSLNEWNNLDKSLRDVKSLLIFKQIVKTLINC